MLLTQKKSTSGLYKRLSTKRSLTLEGILIMDSYKQRLKLRDKLRPYKLRPHKLRPYKLRLHKLRLHKLCLYKLCPTNNVRSKLRSNLYSKNLCSNYAP